MSANGARFHVVDAAPDSDGELVLFLHDFPQFWFAWRHQLPVLAQAGYRAVAIDVRGYGASDKPPRGYDVGTLVSDVSGIIRSLGYRKATLVGLGLGGWLAWATAMYRPNAVESIVVVGMGHPRVVSRPWVSAFTGQGRLDMLKFALPGLPERAIRQRMLVRSILSRWGADPDIGWLSEREIVLYEDAMMLPAVDRSALGYLRWIVRAQNRTDTRAFLSLARGKVPKPVLQVMGEKDGFINHVAASTSSRYASGLFTIKTISGSGHYVPEQAPEEFSQTLLNWLGSRPAI